MKPYHQHYTPCAWCLAERGDRSLRDTHGICEAHAVQLLADFKAEKERRAAEKERRAAEKTFHEGNRAL